MRYQLLTAAMLCAFVNFVLGCAAPARGFIGRESIARLTTEKIIKVTLRTGEVVRFDAGGGRYHENYKNKQRVIVGRTEVGKPVVIGLEQVLRACIEKDHIAEEDGKEAFSTLFIAFIFGLLVAALANGSSGS